MTTTITLSHDVTTEQARRVADVLERAQYHNPNWSGADFEVVRGDFTEITGAKAESYDAYALYQEVLSAIDHTFDHQLRKHIMTTSINHDNNEFGDIVLADGRTVRLTQQAWSDDHQGEAAWFAHGYLSTEDADDESGPTVTVRWDSLGNEQAEDDADWAHPDSVEHYALGELLA